MKNGRPDIRSDAHKEVKKFVPPQRRDKREVYEYSIDRKNAKMKGSALKSRKKAAGK